MAQTRTSPLPRIGLLLGFAIALLTSPDLSFAQNSPEGRLGGATDPGRPDGASEDALANVQEAGALIIGGVGAAAFFAPQFWRESNVFNLDYPSPERLAAALESGEIERILRTFNDRARLDISVNISGRQEVLRLEVGDLRSRLNAPGSDIRGLSVEGFRSPSTRAATWIAVVFGAAALERLGLATAYAVGWREPNRTDGYYCATNYPEVRGCSPNTIFSRVFDAARTPLSAISNPPNPDTAPLQRPGR